VVVTVQKDDELPTKYAVLPRSMAVTDHRRDRSVQKGGIYQDSTENYHKTCIEYDRSHQQDSPGPIDRCSSFPIFSLVLPFFGSHPTESSELLSKLEATDLGISIDRWCLDLELRIVLYSLS